jgi:hypothetical protein
MNRAKNRTLSPGDSSTFLKKNSSFGGLVAFFAKVLSP